MILHGGLLLRERGSPVLWDRRKLRLISVLLWLWPVSSKSSTSWLGLELLRWQLSEWVAGVLLLLRECSTVWVRLVVSRRLRLLHEARGLLLESCLLLESRLLRVERLLRLLLEALLVASLLVLH